ncbi:unnamed protein product [Rotaria socialis]|uniref:ATP-grasp domain-containing protein n=1 Tax=Rotaria socialis TaxID=392032 RepID=A0A817V1E9_9BILA|nr:unnamed protein product [Rotaria socialis]
MTEENLLRNKTDPSTTSNSSNVESRLVNHVKKNEIHKENSLYPEPISKCYIGAGNNSELIENILTSIGYERQLEKIDDFKIKWVQCIQSINWNLFKDGEQMVNHIQGEDYFTTKVQLCQSLQTYEKMSMTMQKRPQQFLSLNEYVPQTFKLDEKNDRDAFFNIHKPGDVWICKPSGLNQGKGIYLVRDIEELKEKFSEIDSLEKKKQILIKPMKRIVQHYIMNPLLINGKKFDIRCYMLISSVKPLLIFYHSGYIRLSMFDFDNNDENLLTHLTNQYMQKKDPKYYDLKEETAWTMEQFNDYINKNVALNKNLEQDWILNVLPKIIQRIMLNVIESIRMRLKRRVGCFGLYGYDFMIDQDMKVWLIEINVNPALTTNTNTLVQAIPPVVKESILLSIECFDKIRHGQKIFPLKSLKGYKCIYNELERKNSLPFIEQKRAISSLPNIRKVNATPISCFPSRSLNKQVPKSNDQQNSSIEKPVISYTIRQKDENKTCFHTNEKLSTSNRANNCLSSDNDPMIMKYQTIQRYRTNFEILKPATVIAEEWNNLDEIQKTRLSIGGSKTLGHGTVASFTDNHHNSLRNGRQTAILHTTTIDTFFKQAEKATLSLSLTSSSSSSSSLSKATITTNRHRINIHHRRKLNITRPYSVSIIKELNSFENNKNNNNNTFNQFGFTPRLTKSALIYQLIRSRLEANLARSMSSNKNRSINNFSLISSSNL